MYSLRALIAGMIVLVVSTTIDAGPAIKERPAVSDAEYEVYAAVIDRLSCDVGDVARPLAVNASLLYSTEFRLRDDPTFNAGSIQARVRQRCGAVIPDLLPRFVRANEAGGELTASHFAGMHVLLMSSREWLATRARYEAGHGDSGPPPCALVTFSHVAFDSGGVWAAVVVNRSCGPGCGGPACWLLRRTASGWGEVCAVDEQHG